MKVRFTYFFWLAFVLFFAPAVVSAQSEADLLKQADKLFENGRYVPAAPLYQKLLALNPKSSDYNYKYGACLLYSDGVKNNGLKYLRFASQDPAVSTDCYFFLGKGYHLNYQFSEAIVWYKKFNGIATPKQKEKYQVDRHIEMCNNGKKLLKNVTDVIVIDKREYNEEQFFRLYSMENIGGQLLVVDALQSKIDKQKEHKIIIHNPKNSDIIFYSSYGNDGKSGKDIYKVKRLPNGEWADPQPVNGFVNTPFDEDFPYLHPDGTTLYFCSKGHNSMGGYDVFRSTYDPETDRFGPPENVDFAISSPDDDLLYIVDSLNRTAWFASARESQNGQIHVYNVRVERIPVMIAILKGTFINEIDPDARMATISIEDAKTGEVVGIYNSKSTDGSYLITLPKSGKYKYTVKTESGAVHSVEVDVPFQKEIRPLKQDMIVYRDGGVEKLRINNRYNEEVEDADQIIALVMKERGSLNPNADMYDLDSLDKTSDSIKNAIIDEVDLGNLTNEELIALVKEDVTSLENESNELKEKSESACVLAQEKHNEALVVARNAENLLNSLKTISDPQERRQVQADATNLHNQSKNLMLQANAAYQLCQQFEKQHQEKEKEAEIAREFAKGIETALNTNDKEKAVEQLSKQKEYIKKVMARDTQNSDALNEKRNEATAKQNEANASLKRIQMLRNDEKQVTIELNNLKTQLDSERNQKKREELQKEIDRKTEDLALIQSDIKSETKKNEMLTRESNDLLSQVSVMEEILAGNLNGRKLTDEEKSSLAQNIGSGNQAIEKNDQLVTENNVEDRNSFEMINELAEFNPVYKELLNKKNNAGSNTNEKEKLEEQNRINQEMNSSIENDLKDLRTQLSQETNTETKNELEKRIETLTSLKNNNEQEIARNNTRLQEVSNTTENNTISLNTEIKVETIDPDYLRELNTINDAAIPENEKLKRQNDLNQSLISKTEEIIKEKQNQLATVSAENKAALEKQIELLKDIRSDKMKEIASNNKILETENTSTVSVTEENVVSVVDPEFEKRITDARTNSSGEEEKLKKENEIYRDFITKTDNLIAQKQKELENASPAGKEKIQIEIQLLQKQKLDKEDALAANNRKLDQPEIVNNMPDLAFIQTEHEKNLEQIRNSDDTEKNRLSKINKANNDFIDAANELIRQKNTEMVNADADKKLKLSEELLALEAAVDQRKNEIAANNDRIRAINDQDSNATTDVLVLTVDPSYENRKNSIIRSNKSEVRKTGELSSLNQQTLDRTNKEIESLQMELRDPDIADRSVKAGKLEELISLRNGLEKEKSVLDKQLVDAGIKRGDPNGNPVKSYADPESYRSLDAQKEIEKSKSDKELITQLEKVLEELTIQRSEETDENEKKRLDKEIAKTEKQLLAVELSYSKTIEKANSIEKTQNENVLNEVKSVAENKNNTAWENAVYYETLSKTDFDSAAYYRNLAKSEKDKEIKNASLKKANELEQSGNENLELAEINYRNAGHEETGGYAATIEIGDLIPDYSIRVVEINTGNNEAEKAEKRKQLNAELVSIVELELKKLENQNDQASVERRKQLTSLKKKAEEDIRKDEELIASNENNAVTVISNAPERNSSYSSSFDYSYYQASEEIGKIKETLNEISTAERQLEELITQRNSVSDRNEQLRLDEEINRTKKLITEKELSVATVFNAANQKEKENNDTELFSLRRSLNDSGNNVNSEKLTNAEQLEKKALTEFTIASDIRKQAEIESDPEKKNDLLKQANDKERIALGYQKDAEKIYSALLAEVDITVVNDPEIKTTEILIPENPSDRESAQLQKKADDLNERAEELRTRAQFLEDSATTVKKKHRQAIIDEAAQLRTEAGNIDSEVVMISQKANDKKREEDEILLAQERRKEEEKLKENLLLEVLKTAEYSSFFNFDNDVEKKKLEISNTEKEIRRQNEIAANMRTEASQMRRSAESETDPQHKSELLNYANDLENNAKNADRKADNLNAELETKRTELLNAEKRKEDYLATIDPVKAQNIRIATDGIAKLPLPEKTGNTTVINNDDPLAISTTIPEKVENDIILKTDQTIYTTDNPIPVTEKMPMGLFYKVQVGAFRNPLDPDHVKGYVPVTAEKLDNGITRYMVGYFTSVESANAAKNDLDDRFNGAFVVAYCNGKRISLAEARAGGCGTVATENNQYVNNNNNQNPETNQNQNPVNNQNTDVVTNFNPDPRMTDYYTSVPDAAKANQIEVIPGLFYTVQIGVFSRPVSPDKIFNISPLNSELTQRGQVRYSTGIFTDINEAVRRKEEINRIGIPDAFVTVYFNGQRISVTQATDTLGKYGNGIYAKTDGTQPSNTVENIPGPVNAIDNTASSYKVILGIYKKEVPVRDAEIFLNNITAGIRKGILNDGSAIYYIDNVPEKPKADRLAEDFRNKGLTNTSVVTELPGTISSAPAAVKTSSGVFFQVYIGEFRGEVPAEATEIYLNNYDKGVKRKKLEDGTIVYYVVNSTLYDDALKMKAHFIGEGLSSVRIVAMKDEKEIPLSQAFGNMTFKVILGEFPGEVPSEIRETYASVPQAKVTEISSDNNFIIAEVQNISDFESAMKIKAAFISEGLSSVRIVALKEGKEVSLSEAIGLMYE